MSKYSMHLLVCGGTGCKSQESDQLSEKLKKELSKQGLEDTVQVIMTGCFGFWNPANTAFLWLVIPIIMST